MILYSFRLKAKTRENTEVQSKERLKSISEKSKNALSTLNDFCSMCWGSGVKKKPTKNPHKPPTSQNHPQTRNQKKQPKNLPSTLKQPGVSSNY